MIKFNYYAIVQIHSIVRRGALLSNDGQTLQTNSGETIFVNE